MNVKDLQAWFDLALAVAAVVAVLVTVLRWGNRRLEDKIISELREATQQVRTDANGGQSLMDLHHKVDALVGELRALRQAVLSLEDEVAAIEQDLEGK